MNFDICTIEIFAFLFLIATTACAVPTYSAPASCISRDAALAEAISDNAGSVLRSILLEASLDNLWNREFLAMLMGSKCAASKAIRVVELVTSDARPPIVPANAKADFESAISKLSGLNFRSTLSRVVNFENLPALTTLRPPSTRSASKA